MYELLVCLSVLINYPYLENLNHEDFEIRQKATQCLINRGKYAIPAVYKYSMKSPHLEVRARCNKILDVYTKDVIRDENPLLMMLSLMKTEGYEYPYCYNGYGYTAYKNTGPISYVLAKYRNEYYRRMYNYNIDSYFYTYDADAEKFNQWDMTNKLMRTLAVEYMVPRSILRVWLYLGKYHEERFDS